MSQVFTEEKLRFEFPDDWLIVRPDMCSFYVDHFQSLAGGCKEMDFLCFERVSRTLWLIEVKDYGWFGRTKTLDLVLEVAEKVRDSLALLPASVIDVNSTAVEGRCMGQFWRQVRTFTSIRIVLHCEIPASPSKLHPGVKDYANLQNKLRQTVRAVDPHAKVSSIGHRNAVVWAVSRT